ncbi:MAG: ABC transporter ATP-binding protein [Pirellulales bacterium]
MSPFKRLLAILKPDRADVWAIVWYAVGIGVLMLATPIAVEALVTTVAFTGVVQPLVVLSLVLFGCLIFAAILRAMQTYLVEILQRRIFIRVTADLARRLPRVKVSEYDGNHGPELVNRFFDVLTVQKVSATLLMDGVTIVLQTLIGLTVVAFYHPLLLGLVVVLLVCIALILFGLGRGAVSSSIHESIAKYGVAEWLQELARHPQTFKNAGGADYAMRRIDRLGAEYLIARDQAFRILFRQIVASLILQATAATALLGVGGWLVMAGSMTLGQLIAAELILSSVVLSFVKFGKHLESFYDLMAAADKLGHLLDLRLETTAGEDLVERPTGAALVVDGLSFGYDDHHPLFHELDFKLASGERVGISAREGRGKTTFAEILFGLRTPQDGRIAIDGTDYRDVRKDDLRKHVALVANTEIFDGSLIENIRMGRDAISTAHIRETLDRLGLLDDVMRLPDGLQTQLATGGRPLSNNQIQRLMLTRAVVGKPRLLILDESLDGFTLKSAPELVPALFDRAAPWSLILITERDEYLAACDRVFHLPDHAAAHAHDVPPSHDAQEH